MSSSGPTAPQRLDLSGLSLFVLRYGRSVHWFERWDCGSCHNAFHVIDGIPHVTHDEDCGRAFDDMLAWFGEVAVSSPGGVEQLGSSGAS